MINTAHIDCLKSGQLANDWTSTAVTDVSLYSPEELIKLENAICEFIRHCLARFQLTSEPLEEVGYAFAFDPPLKLAEDNDRVRLKEVLRDVDLPLSIRCFYGMVAHLNLAQHGTQMFDREHGLFYFTRFLTFTMPPINTALSTRWDEEATDWPQDDEGQAAKFFLLEEFPEVDEQPKGFDVPSNQIDPVIDSEGKHTFLDWFYFQSRWGGLSRLMRAFENDAHEEFTKGLRLEMLSKIFPVGAS